ncbi:MAG: lycopene cyclase domain-containing protein [Candidatus Omnitrophota bacterium]|nr:MAG: lycopene cyclase domain-containing protein [Candidatus Omnitrophota bacterium]
MSKYIQVLLLSISVPFLFSFWPGLNFYRKPRALIYSLSLILLIFGGWDIFATWRGHWSFDPEGVWGIKIINLPVEEALFFIVIPYCCLFTWEAIKYFKRKIK